MTILQQLVKEGFLTNEKATALKFEIKESGKKEEEIILQKGIVPEEVLFSLKSKNLKIPLREVNPGDVSLNVLELIPEETARNYQMIPLAKKEKILEIGMVYPEDLKAQEALNFLSRLGKVEFDIFLITPTTFNNFLKRYRDLKKEVGRALEELETENKAVKSGEQQRSKREEILERLVEEAPITKVVAVILRHAVEGGASDVHIEPTRDKLRIRFRLEGILHSSIILPLKVHLAVVARIKILANLKIDETRIPQDGRFSTKIDEKEVDFRVSTLPTTLGEKVVIRVLDPTVGLKKFEDLGLSSRNFEVVKKAISKPYGMILSTGPTSSGKTTTLYAILNILNKEGVNIITLEDPVEYFIEGVNQSQVRPEIDYDFATGLRHILRQDPNIIMVGEIRDRETANMATHAALTGHIVLSTLHTNDAVGAIPRLLDLGVDRFLIPSTLSVSMAQRLVRKLCPFCRKKVKPPKDIKDLIVKELNSMPPSARKDFSFQEPVIFEPQGCLKCDKGFWGRIALFEVLAMTDELAEIILKEPSETRIRAEAKNQGMVTMKQDGILKALEGVTTIEEVLRVAEEK